LTQAFGAKTANKVKDRVLNEHVRLACHSQNKRNLSLIVCDDDGDASSRQTMAMCNSMKLPATCMTAKVTLTVLIGFMNIRWRYETTLDGTNTKCMYLWPTKLGPLYWHDVINSIRPAI